MDTARCQELAERLHALLLERLGMGLDTRRMLREPLYARDVLLVCAAHPGTELAALAWAYRAAALPGRRATDAAAVTANTTTNTAPDTNAADDREHDSQATLLQPAARRANDHVVHGQDSTKAHPDTTDSEADPGPQPRSSRSPLSRFSRLTRFSASIFGGSLFEGTVFGPRRPDPQTDFGDESFIAPPPTARRRIGDRPGEQRAEQHVDKRLDEAAAPRRSRWFGR